MTKFSKAEEIFKDLTEEVKSQIFAIAEGKLVYFPKNQKKKQIDEEKVLVLYADHKKKDSYEKIAQLMGTNKVKIHRIIKQERVRFSKERVQYWTNQGLSLREIARLFKKSHEAMRQMVD